MSVVVENGKMRVSAGYSLKVPHEVQYASQEAHIGLSLEFDVDGESSAILAQGEGLEAAIAQQVKLAVFAQLGVDATDGPNGIVMPALTAPARNAAPATPKGSFTPKGSGGGGGGSQYGPPKADVTQQPVVTFDDGNGVHAYYDLRSLKADGTFKPNAADFRSVSDGTKKQVWLRGKDGSVNARVASSLEAMGFDPNPYDEAQF